jgi:hypothetical protein
MFVVKNGKNTMSYDSDIVEVEGGQLLYCIVKMPYGADYCNRSTNLSCHRLFDCDGSVW